MKKINLVGVFAHPDDEISIAGLLQSAMTNGFNIHLVCATRGGAGRIRNKKFRNLDNVELTALRTKEFEEVCKQLGVLTYHFLDLEDGDSKNWDKVKTQENLLKIFDEISPEYIITFDRNGCNGHPDHKNISELTNLAYLNSRHNSAELINITLFPRSFMERKLWYLSRNLRNKLLSKISVEDEEVSVILKLSREELKKKIELANMHKSQFPDEKNRYYKLPKFIFKKAANYECYFSNSANIRDKLSMAGFNII